MKKTKKQTLKSILRVVMLVLCGGILGVNLYLANANKLVGNQMPMPFGYGSAVVLSGSMEPELSVGDLIIVNEAQPYDINDIVVFQDGRSLVVHRVIEIDGDKIVTKGDANNTADSPIDKTAVKGTVVAVLPAVGSVISLIKTPLGTILLVTAAVILVELPYRKEKQKDNEERQKIIDEINRLKNDK